MKTTDTAFDHAVHAETFDDIIFDGRNLKYGAYSLRKYYYKDVLLSLLAMLIIAFVICFVLYHHASHRPTVKIIETQPITITLLPSDVIPFDYPQQSRIEIPVDAARVNNTGPMVVVDDPVTNDPVPAQTELINQLMNNSIEAGSGILIIAPPAPDDGIVDGDNTYNFTEVTEQASFKRGTLNDFRKWLSKNIRYSEDAVKNDIKGTVHAKFTVGKDGRICDVVIEKGIHPVIDKAVLDALLASPKWEPAKMNGRAVNVFYYVPVRFDIQQ
ncbi:MAG: energy transducer TonB [Bacteroidales bacterium]|nr:energy transducer TonB [Bacteroidales bacterium]